jgi:nucleotide-binding universal stress UspA family protein
MKTFHRILVPVDGSPASNQALVAALDMARGTDTEIKLVHHLNEFDYLNGFQYAPQLVREARRIADGVLTQAFEMAAAAGVKAQAQLVEEAGARLGEAIAHEATAWHADLIVVGTHGRHGIQRLMLGSGAEQIIRLAPCAVLAYRETPLN